MDCVLEQLLNKLRDLSKMALDYHSDYARIRDNFPIKLRGYSHSILTLAVHKETSSEFAIEQATFMMFLGEQVCPKILSINNTSYVMEYLSPTWSHVRNIILQEEFLEQFVWNRTLEDVPYAKQIGDESWRDELEKSINVKVPDWALDTPCLIHGDPTLDNTFRKIQEDKPISKSLRISDPIPPHRLVRPSIRAIDHGKMLQSFLGWEVVLRDAESISYRWPNYMLKYDTARRATFWAMVALKRIALRNSTPNAGKWAAQMAMELEKCM
jgi:hypothetical protein